MPNVITQVRLRCIPPPAPVSRRWLPLSCSRLARISCSSLAAADNRHPFARDSDNEFTLSLSVIFPLDPSSSAERGAGQDRRHQGRRERLSRTLTHGRMDEWCIIEARVQRQRARGAEGSQAKIAGLVSVALPPRLPASLTHEAGIQFVFAKWSSHRRLSTNRLPLLPLKLLKHGLASWTKKARRRLWRTDSLPLPLKAREE